MRCHLHLPLVGSGRRPPICRRRREEARIAQVRFRAQFRRPTKIDLDDRASADYVSGNLSRMHLSRKWFWLIFFPPVDHRRRIENGHLCGSCGDHFESINFDLYVQLLLPRRIWYEVRGTVLSKRPFCKTPVFCRVLISFSKYQRVLFVLKFNTYFDRCHQLIHPIHRHTNCFLSKPPPIV